MSQRKAIALLVCTAILWSSGGFLIKWIPWHPLAIAGVRSAIAIPLLWAVLRRPQFHWSVAQIGAGVAYAATVLLYVSAVKMTTAANAILLQYTAPVWVALFSVWFLSERVTWLDWVSVIVVLAGMGLFFHEGLASTSLAGDVLAVLSGVTMAWMTLFMRKQKADSPLESILLGNAMAAVVGVPFAFGQPSPELRGWIGLVLLGLVQIGVSYILYAHAIKYVTALETVLVSTIEPILNPIWVLFLVGERPNSWALVGGALVVLAIAARGALHALGLDMAGPKASVRGLPK